MKISFLQKTKNIVKLFKYLKNGKPFIFIGLTKNSQEEVIIDAFYYKVTDPDILGMTREVHNAIYTQMQAVVEARKLANPKL